MPAPQPATETEATCGNVTIVFPPGQYMDCVPDGKGPDGKPKFKAIIYAIPANLTVKAEQHEWLFSQIKESRQLKVDFTAREKKMILKGEPVALKTGEKIKLRGFL